VRVKLGHRLRHAHGHAIAKPIASRPIPHVKAAHRPRISPCLAASSTGERLTPADEMARTVSSSWNLTRRRWSNTEKGGWKEIGRLDEMGIHWGASLRRTSTSRSRRSRSISPCATGWTRFVVTDHGWLLVPGGMPKVDLPAHLVATKWARCAQCEASEPGTCPRSGGSGTPRSHRLAAGHWLVHRQHRIRAWRSQPQECVVPDMLVEQAKSRLKAQITEISWRGMRCRSSLTRTSPDCASTSAQLETGRSGRAAHRHGQGIGWQRSSEPGRRARRVRGHRGDGRDPRCNGAGARLSAHEIGEEQ